MDGKKRGDLKCVVRLLHVQRRKQMTDAFTCKRYVLLLTQEEKGDGMKILQNIGFFFSVTTRFIDFSNFSCLAVVVSSSHVIIRYTPKERKLPNYMGEGKFVEEGLL